MGTRAPPPPPLRPSVPYFAYRRGDARAGSRAAGWRCKSGAEGKAGDAWRTLRGQQWGRGGKKPDITPHGHNSKVCIWEQLSLPSASPPGKIWARNINCTVNSAYHSFFAPVTQARRGPLAPGRDACAPKIKARASPNRGYIVGRRH